jgi:hypothetical protein
VAGSLSIISAMRTDDAVLVGVAGFDAVAVEKQHSVLYP